MTEEDLLAGVTDALSHAGYLWTHQRRSDLALTMGTPGVPDVIAVHPKRGKVLVLELKSAKGRMEPGQAEWLDAFRGAGIPARIVTPDGYDDLIHELLGDKLVKAATWRSHPENDG